MDDQPIPILKSPRLFNDTLIRIEDTTTTTPPPIPALKIILVLAVFVYSLGILKRERKKIIIRFV